MERNSNPKNEMPTVEEVIISLSFLAVGACALLLGLIELVVLK